MNFLLIYGKIIVYKLVLKVVPLPTEIKGEHDIASKDLRVAKENKTDEFYPQLTDIELELKHYKNYFKDKIVSCNCDDPYESNFFKYFAMNFNYLDLTNTSSKRAYKTEINEVKDFNEDGVIDLSDVEYY